MDRTTLDQLAEQWKAIDNSEERNQFYIDSVFPVVKEYVVLREQKKEFPRYDYLILSVGTSPGPIILSILTLQPTQVCFLYTTKSKEHLDRIIEEADLKISQVEMAEISEIRLQDIYQKIREVYEKWGKPDHIAVDPTGGTKAMVAGCTLAGNLIGADLVYVSSDYNGKLGQPNPGTEVLIKLDNPYDVFGDFEFAKAQALFRQLDYTGAKLILEDLERKTSTPDRYKPLTLLCSAYANWDDFEIEQALANLKESADLLHRSLRLKTNDKLVNDLAVIQQQIQVLDNLHIALKSFQQKNETEVLSNPELYLPLMGTLRACAIRQEKRGKRDVAALLWYRLLEILSQQRLSTYGLITEEPDYGNTKLQSLAIDLDLLLKKYSDQNLGKSKKSGKVEISEVLPSPIDLIKGYKLLKALDDPLAISQNLSRIINQVQSRNNSIFAHGFKPLSEKSFEDFKGLVESLVETFQAIQPENQACWEESLFLEEIS